MIKSAIRILTLLAAIAIASPAHADWCLQMSTNLSGSLGFLRLKGAVPKGKGRIAALKGRRGNMDDYGPVYGGATVNDENTCLDIYVHFSADGDPGEALLAYCAIPPATLTSVGVGTVLTGQSTYGTTPAWAFESATVVTCP